MKRQTTGQSNKPLLIGMLIGVGFSAFLVLIGLAVSGKLPRFTRPASPLPILRVALADPVGDQLDKTGQVVATAPGYLDIVGAEIKTGNQAQLGLATTIPASAAADTPLLASITITMAAPIPPPREQSTIFSLGVSIDRDGDLQNNDSQTPGLAGTDATIAINCDPSRSSCLEGIAMYEQNNWTAKATPITWQINGSIITMIFALDFLPKGVAAVGWRVYSSVVDAQQGGPSATDVTPAVDAPLAKVQAEP